MPRARAAKNAASADGAGSQLAALAAQQRAWQASLARALDGDSEGGEGESKGAEPWPKLVVFDLDYTLWPLWVDTHVTAPLKRAPGGGAGSEGALNKVVDRYGEVVSFYPHVPAILMLLHDRGVRIGIASRTSAPAAARQALTGLVLPDTRRGKAEGETVKAISLFHYQEIYPGSKLTHFSRLRASCASDARGGGSGGGAVAYEDMVFFDDEHRNAEVGRELGVLFVLVGHEGTDLAAFEKGVRQWRARRRARKEAAGGGEGAGEEEDE